MELPPLKRYIFSHYFYNGIAAASGVAGIALLTYGWFGFHAAAAASTGAMVVSIVDTPAPVHHKFNELLAAVSLATLTSLVTGLSLKSPWLLAAAILAVSFGASMLTAYGKRAMSLSFLLMLTMVLTMGTPLDGGEEVLRNSLIAGVGGLVYAGYALGVAALLWYRTKQQALAECLYEFAQYLDIKSRCFDTGIDLDDSYAAIIAQQALITERLQTARDFIFRNLHSDLDGRLAATLFATIDLYEYIVSSQVDYAALRRHFGGSDVMMFLRDLIRKGQQDLERVSWAITRNLPPGHVINFRAELFAIAHELDRLFRESEGKPEDKEALEILRASFARVRQVVEHIEQMHPIARTLISPERFVGEIDLRPFLSHPSYNLHVLREDLSFDSPILRHAVRTTMAMGCGYLLARTLPYATHGHWILLTIAVIMRANFSLSKQRRKDRVIGNVLGCVFTAVLLRFVHQTPAIVFASFVAMALAHTFATINYRFTATAACVMGLLQLHLLDSGSQFVITERLADTFIGAALAYLFSFVLPHWEYRGIPRLILDLLTTNTAYARAALTYPSHDAEYRIARKQLHDAIAALSRAVGRMLAEPASRTRSVAELKSFLALNYLLASQLAAVRGLLQRRADDLDLNRVIALMDHIKQQVESYLAQAGNEVERLVLGAELDFPAPTPVDAMPISETTVSVSDSHVGRLLDRRLQMVRAHAREILELSARMALVWRPTPIARESSVPAMPAAPADVGGRS